MTAPRERFEQALANAGGLKVIRVDDTVHAFTESERATVERDVAKALTRGALVTREDGRQEWIRTAVVFDPKADTAAGRYDWNADGERVRHRRHLMTRSPDGTVTAATMADVWRRP